MERKEWNLATIIFRISILLTKGIEIERYKIKINRKENQLLFYTNSFGIITFELGNNNKC